MSGSDEVPLTPVPGSWACGLWPSLDRLSGLTLGNSVEGEINSLWSAVGGRQHNLSAWKGSSSGGAAVLKEEWGEALAWSGQKMVVPRVPGR